MNDIFLKIKQLFCQHWFEFIAKRHSRSIFKCNKCGIYYVFITEGKRRRYKANCIDSQYCNKEL
jgi:hypothetical protein